MRPADRVAGPSAGQQDRTAVLRVDVISLFPQMFEPFLEHGVCGRAIQRGKVEVHIWNPRRHATNVHQTIDDRPYGGGPGMVMMAPPLAATLTEIRAQSEIDGWSHGPVILMAPGGERLAQPWVERRLAAMADGLEQVTLVCGRYEGIDQRFIDAYVDEQVSLGPFVLSGGELPALVILDAWIRRLPGVLNHVESSLQESFMEGERIDHPHYTRPEVFEGVAVPQVLLSGHHGKITDWRARESARLTAVSADLRAQLTFQKERSQGLISAANPSLSTEDQTGRSPGTEV